MHSLHLRKDDLGVVSLVEPTNAFLYAVLLALLEARVHELQGAGSPNINSLSFVVCFATILPNLMDEPSKSHLVHSPHFSPCLSDRGRLILVNLSPKKI